MDIEQLKLVLETLQSVGHEASTLAVLWMWLKFGASLLHTLFWGAVIVGVAHAIRKAWLALECDRKSEAFMREMRDTLGTGTSGCLTDGEFSSTSTKLRELAHAYRATKGK